MHSKQYTIKWFEHFLWNKHFFPHVNRKIMIMYISENSFFGQRFSTRGLHNLITRITMNYCNCLRLYPKLILKIITPTNLFDTRARQNTLLQLFLIFLKKLNNISAEEICVWIRKLPRFFPLEWLSAGCLSRKFTGMLVTFLNFFRANETLACV